MAAGARLWRRNSICADKKIPILQRSRNRNLYGSHRLLPDAPLASWVGKASRFTARRLAHGSFTGNMSKSFAKRQCLLVFMHERGSGRHAQNETARAEAALIMAIAATLALAPGTGHCVRLKIPHEGKNRWTTWSRANRAVDGGRNLTIWLSSAPMARQPYVHGRCGG